MEGIRKGEREVMMGRGRKGWREGGKEGGWKEEERRQSRDGEMEEEREGKERIWR